MPAKPTVTFRESDRRPGFRARHLMRQVARNRNQNVRRSAFNELMVHLSRRHRQKLPAAPVSLKAPGDHRPLTLKARHLLRSLRGARSWPVVRRILAELHREIERGKRMRTRVARSKPVRSVRKAGRKTVRAGRAVRSGVQRAHEPHLARAERKHAGRDAGTVRPAPEPVKVRAVMVPREPEAGRTVRAPGGQERAWREAQAGRLEEQAAGARSRGRPGYAGRLDEEASRHRSWLADRDPAPHARTRT